MIDDLFGRQLGNGVNKDRDNLCASFLLKDVTDQEKPSRQKIRKPIAEAVFCRGQQPACAGVGDTVENDFRGTLEVIRSGWNEKNTDRWSLLLLDLCFYTGRVTGTLSPAVAGTDGKVAQPGMPEGRAEDIVESQFFGLTLLREIQTEFPDLPVVILSSQNRDKVSQQYSEFGALAFLPRSGEGSGDAILKQYISRHGLMPDPHGLIVGQSLPLLKALRSARRTAYVQKRENILIRGERGVGKEEFSKFIHRVHPTRAKQSLVSVNSAVLTSELFQSELFGILKGAASMVAGSSGLIRSADKGDLFFDEVKDMVPQAQAGLLRFLEAGEIRTVGSASTTSVDVRVISATNADLETLAAGGSFREDLLDRLRRGGKIVLPPLRQRKEDIPLLAKAFLNQAETARREAANDLGVPKRSFTDEAIAWLQHKDWPGNVRQLHAVIFKAVGDSDVEFIFPQQLEKACLSLGIGVPDSSTATISRSQSPSSPQRYVVQKDEIQPQANKLQDILENEVQAEFPHTDHSPPRSPDQLVDLIRDFEFDISNSELLKGKYEAIDEASSMLIVKLLEAALIITKDKVKDEFVPTAAAKFLTTQKISGTSKAYDLIKRLIKRNKKVQEKALENPILRSVFEKAEANRPTKR